jgi:hypothetical protein
VITRGCPRGGARRFAEQRRDRGRLVGVMIVVAEHAQHGHVDSAERPREAGRLLAGAALGEIAGEQQQVGIGRDAPELRQGQRPAVAFAAHVPVADRGDADHPSVSRTGRVPTCTVTSL